MATTPDVLIVGDDAMVSVLLMAIPQEMGRVACAIVASIGERSATGRRTDTIVAFSALPHTI